MAGSRQNCSSADSRHNAVGQEILILKPMQILSCGFLRLLAEDLFTAEVVVENHGTGFEPLLAGCDSGEVKRGKQASTRQAAGWIGSGI